MDTQNLIKQVTTDVDMLLEEKLRNGDITKDTVAKISQYVHSSLDEHLTDTQLYEIIEHFDEQFPELLPIVVKYSEEYEKELHQLIGTDVHELLKKGKIEEATKEMESFELGEGQEVKNESKDENAS